MKWDLHTENSNKSQTFKPNMRLQWDKEKQLWSVDNWMKVIFWNFLDDYASCHRRSLSLGKANKIHDMASEWFIYKYNQNVIVEIIL